MFVVAPAPLLKAIPYAKERFDAFYRFLRCQPSGAKTAEASARSGSKNRFIINWYGS